MDSSRTLSTTSICILLTLCTLLHINLASAAPRVIALEYSFVDALSLIRISPTGIADDGDPGNLLPALRAKLDPWQSVGSRSQPNLEEIARLKPDLILADQARHTRVLGALEQIAPTLLLPSRGSTYQEVLETAQVIGDTLGRGKDMRQQLLQHQQKMNRYRQAFSQYEGAVLFAAVSDQGIWLHSPNSFAGSLMRQLGLSSPLSDSSPAYQPGNLELLLKLNPDWLLTGAYASHTLLDDWQKLPIFDRLKAPAQQHLVSVSPQLWSLGRGILAAEAMAARLNQLLATEQAPSLAEASHAF